MTVIAWDGRYVAADKQGTNQGAVTTVTKLFIDGPKVYAICGNPDHGMMMVAWLRSGGKPADFPKEPDQKQSAWTYVFEYGKHVACYEQKPVPFFVEDPIFGGGSGGDLAKGAMEMGASAKRAVEVACKWESGCGQGVDVIDLKELSVEPRHARHEPATSVAGWEASPVFK